MLPIIILILNYIYYHKKIKKNKHEDYNIIGLNIFKLFSYLLGFEQKIIFGDINFKINKPTTASQEKIIKKNEYLNINRILLISNHLNVLDCVNIQKFISSYYTDYLPVYIMSESVKKIPIYGKWVDKHCILIKNNIKYDKKIIEDKCKFLYNKSTKDKKYIFILFPEGCLRNAHNIIRNNNWCIKNNIKKFNNLINPRKTGFDLILNNFKPQKLILTSMIYGDDILNKKSQNFYSLFILNVAKKCNIYVCDISEYIKDINYNIDIKNILPNSYILENSIIYRIWQKHDILHLGFYNKIINSKNINTDIIYILLKIIIYIYILQFLIK